MKAHAAALPELRGEDRALFASDVHLDERDAATERMFLDALAREGEGASHLFLLGDLFEAWIGDDDPGAPGKRVAQHLAALARSGTRLYLMRGNRDFLLGTGFAATVGARLLPDPCVIELHGTRVVLAHGCLLYTSPSPRD